MRGYEMEGDELVHRERGDTVEKRGASISTQNGKSRNNESRHKNATIRTNHNIGLVLSNHISLGTSFILLFIPHAFD